MEKYQKGNRPSRRNIGKSFDQIWFSTIALDEDQVRRGISRVTIFNKPNWFCVKHPCCNLDLSKTSILAYLWIQNNVNLELKQTFNNTWILNNVKIEFYPLLTFLSFCECRCYWNNLIEMLREFFTSCMYACITTINYSANFWRTLNISLHLHWIFLV